MRILLPRPVADPDLGDVDADHAATLGVDRAGVDLHEWYARAWLDAGGIRVNMISSFDGAGAAGGLSAGLQTPGDNRVYAALRDLADVVLVGSGTARAEGYSPVELGAERQAVRRTYGLQTALPTAVLSRSLNLDPTSRLFAHADPGNRPIVITCAATDPTKRAQLAELAHVAVCGQDAIDYREVRRWLADRGLTRVLCEGGPTIFGQVAGAGELDELCLSLTPLLAGPGATRIISGDEWSAGPTQLTLAGLLEEDGALFLRLMR